MATGTSSTASHPSSTLSNWRLINVDALDPDSSTNFDLSSLAPGHTSSSAHEGGEAEAQQAASQIRQLLRAGDTEGALRGAVGVVPWGAGQRGKEVHAAAVMDVLMGIRQAEIGGVLGRLYKEEGGAEALDTLMKFIYKGMSQTSSPSSKAVSPQATGFSQIQARALGGGAEGGGHGMSVLLSWHEKVVEIAGLGCIMRVMTDRRTV